MEIRMVIFIVIVIQSLFKVQSKKNRFSNIPKLQIGLFRFQKKTCTQINVVKYIYVGVAGLTFSLSLFIFERLANCNCWIVCCWKAST